MRCNRQWEKNGKKCFFSVKCIFTGLPLLDAYKELLSCWSPVFMGVPSQVMQSVCGAKRYYVEAKALLDRKIEQLGPLKYLLQPQRLLEDQVVRILKPELTRGFTRISNMILGKSFTDFFLLVTGREQVTRRRMNEIFAYDRSGKRLVRFPEVGELVDEEMQLGSNGLNPDQFHTIKNAITLSKLVLLPPQELNAIHQYHSGEPTALYPTLDDAIRSNLLIGAVTSIDGSCQWMHTSWPYPRQTGVDTDYPFKRRYSYSPCEVGPKGSYSGPIPLRVPRPSRSYFQDLLPRNFMSSLNSTGTINVSIPARTTRSRIPRMLNVYTW